MPKALNDSYQVGGIWYVACLDCRPTNALATRWQDRGILTLGKKTRQPCMFCGAQPKQVGDYLVEFVEIGNGSVR